MIRPLQSGAALLEDVRRADPDALHLWWLGQSGFLVAGGGPVAARRAARMVSDGALVTVVAPSLCEDLVDLVAQRVAARQANRDWPRR